MQIVTHYFFNLTIYIHLLIVLEFLKILQEYLQEKVGYKIIFLKIKQQHLKHMIYNGRLPLKQFMNN